MELKSSCDENIAQKQKQYPRATKSCCFVGCHNKNRIKGLNTLFKFHRLPPVPKTKPNNSECMEKHYTYYKKLHYRREYLDRCGLKRNDERRDLRICSSHEYEDLRKYISFVWKGKVHKDKIVINIPKAFTENSIMSTMNSTNTINKGIGRDRAVARTLSNFNKNEETQGCNDSWAMVCQQIMENNATDGINAVLP